MILPEYINNDIYRELFEIVTEGLFLVNKQGTILMTNKSGLELFGYGEGELIGQKIEILIPSKFHHSHVKTRTKYTENPIKRSMGKEMDLSAIRKDGILFPVEISLNHFDRDGEPLIIALVSDVSTRKQNEKELKSLEERLRSELENKVEKRTEELSQALREIQAINSNLQEEVQLRLKAEEDAKESLRKEKELSELKSRFVSMASHEFRTPLSGILSSATIISKYQETHQQSNRDKHVHTIQKTVRNLTVILNDFLSLEKLESGKVRINDSIFILSEVLQETILEIETVLKTGQKITFEANSLENLKVHSDAQLLKTIISNLLSNATKYSKENQLIHVLLKRTSTHLEIHIQDEGIGIPIIDQKHLFERFFRAQNATTIQGTGLGLHIVKRNLELIQGSIEFKSSPDKGTLFISKLPLTIIQ